MKVNAGWYCVLIGESNVAIDPAIGGYGVADIYLGEFSPHSRPSRLPGAAAASSARAGFLFGVLRRPLQARQGRQGYSSSASGRLLYSETEPRQSSPSPRVPGSRDGPPRPLYSTSELLVSQASVPTQSRSQSPSPRFKFLIYFFFSPAQILTWRAAASASRTTRGRVSTAESDAKVVPRDDARGVAGRPPRAV